MKRFIKTTGWLAMAAAIIFGTAACSSSDDSIAEQQPVNPTAPKTYTMTVQATKPSGDDAATRGLSLDGKTLNATWKQGETVDVYKIAGDETYTSVGTLTAQADGASATLSGDLSGSFAAGDNLALFFLGGEMHYDGQSGVLLSADGANNSIEDNYDYAAAYGVVTAVEGTTLTVKNQGDNADQIAFANQQAIVKFTLKDKATGSAISVNSLTLHDAGNNIYLIIDYLHRGSANMGDLAVTRSTAGSEFYVAIKTKEEGGAPASLDLTLTAVDEESDPASPVYYTYAKSGVSFIPGQYYEVTVSMTKLSEHVVDIKEDISHMVDNPSLSYTARTGDVLTGRNECYLEGSDETKLYSPNVHITIADGATITLRNATIEKANVSGCSWAGLTCEGDATIILEGTNVVQGLGDYSSGIYVPEGKTLTIRGDGSLSVEGLSGAGIGGEGNIVIESGTITAQGKGLSAAIGSSRGTCGNITITGGTVTATGDAMAAGIGSGYNGSCGNITITGGTVTATGGENAAGIGTGAYGKCGDITIATTVTSVTATKGSNNYPNSYSDAYAIGKGSDNADPRDGVSTGCATVTIGGTVYYDGENYQNGGDTYLSTSPLIYPQ